MKRAFLLVATPLFPLLSIGAFMAQAACAAPTPCDPAVSQTPCVVKASPAAPSSTQVLPQMVQLGDGTTIAAPPGSEMFIFQDPATGEYSVSVVTK